MFVTARRRGKREGLRLVMKNSWQGGARCRTRSISSFFEQMMDQIEGRKSCGKRRCLYLKYLDHWGLTNSTRWGKSWQRKGDDDSSFVYRRPGLLEDTSSIRGRALHKQASWHYGHWSRTLVNWPSIICWNPGAEQASACPYFGIVVRLLVAHRLFPVTRKRSTGDSLN